MNVTSIADIVAPARAALLVWDMQNGLGGNASNAESVHGHVVELVDGARDAGVRVVWSRHVAPLPQHMSRQAVRALLARQGVDTIGEARPFMQDGSKDVGFMDGLAPGEDDLVISKSTPSLFVGTPAELRLRSLDIETLVIAGVATEQGVELTARHAATLGFFPVIVEDAVGSFSDAGHERGLSSLRSMFDVVSTQSVLDLWRAAARTTDERP